MTANGAEMAHTTTFVHEERLAILQQFTAERTATVKDVGEALNQQREALARDAERIAAKGVDHAFLRAAQLLATSLIALFLGIALLMLLARWPFPSRPTPTPGIR